MLGKVSDEDGIPNELLKYCNIDKIVLEYANSLFLDCHKPQQWSNVNILPLPKDGDLSKASNYRVIGLSAMISKVVNKLILNRIQPQLDPLLRNNQNGFRPKRNTTAHILALRRIIEEAKRNNVPATIVFVNFSKAFDSVHRAKMMQILKAYGIPNELVNAIQKLYEGTRAKVLSPDGETEYFKILDVLQGDTLAPYLFTIVIDYIMRMAIDGKKELGFIFNPKKSHRYPAKVITDLDYAEDIALICHKIAQAKKPLNRVEPEAAKNGLYCNAKKTKMMGFNEDSINDMKSISGGFIKEVDNFKYLGGWMKCCQHDVKARKAQACMACHKLKKI